MVSRHVRAIGHGNEDLRTLDPRRDALDQRQKRQVKEHNAIFRMFDDVRELVDVEPGVERMQHGPRPDTAKYSSMCR